MAHPSLLATLAVLASVLAGSAAHAQVRYMDRVPTVAEARSAMGLPATSSVVSARVSPRRKGIAWTSTETVAEAPALAEAPASGLTAGQGLALPVKFDHAAAGVSKASLAYVGAIATVLADDPSLRLVIEGHTDATGDLRANTMLSWERAFAVFRVLVDRYGVDPQRLQPLGLGSSDPLRPSEPAHAMNRRVQFRVSGEVPVRARS